MKKLFIALGIFIGLIFLALLILPAIIKGKVQEKVDQALVENINAHVYYDASSFRLSLIRNFPNLSVGLSNFGIVNYAPFEGDTLVDVKDFTLTVNLKEIIFGDELSLNALYLESPRIQVKILPDGRANYDIAILSEEEVEEDEVVEEFTFAIKKWQISNGFLIYDDQSIPFSMQIQGLEHQGSGDFSLSEFDMRSQTQAEALWVSFDGVEYLTRKQVTGDLIMHMDLNQFKFTFLDNEFKLNDFGFSFDGWFQIPEEGYDMDINFRAIDNSFKSILSLVPGMYMEGFETLKTEGELDFSGFVKGSYNDKMEQMPAFNVALEVRDGMFQYPDLPAAVSNIAISMLVNNEDGVIDNTLVDISQFHMDFGNNPIDGKVLIKNLHNYDMDASLNAKLNLAELNQMFPMEDLSMKGMFTANLVAKGFYDSLANQIPTIDLDMGLANGYLKHKDYPIPMEQVNLRSRVENKSGKMEETLISVTPFSMLLDGEKVVASLMFSDLNDYTWDFSLQGGLDLEKLMKVFPIEGTTLAGRVTADINSKGKMSALEAERYDLLPTKGVLSLQNFKYNSVDVAHEVAISKAEANFNPDKIDLTSFEGTLGKSDLSMTGSLSNYMNYILKDNEVIKGRLDMRSKLFDLNEWMAEDGSEVPDDPEKSEDLALEVIQVPATIDFVLSSQINEVRYDNLSLKNMQGNILVKEGIVNLQGLQFNTLDGLFIMNGTYDPRDVLKPAFDFDLSIKDLSIPKAHASFGMVQSLAPVAANMTGKFSTDFKIAGLLGSDMMPVYESLSGAGLLKIVQASIKDLKILNAVSQVTRLEKTNEGVSLRDVMMQAEIKGGRLFVEPFDIRLGNYKTTISGSNGIDGSLDYLMKMDVPAGVIGSVLNNAIASVAGTKPSGSSSILLNLGVGGTYDEPKVRLLGTGSGQESTAGAARAAVEGRVERETEKVKDEFDKRRQEAEDKARQQARQERERLEKEVEKAKQDAKDDVRERIEDSPVQEEVDKAKDRARDLLRRPRQNDKKEEKKDDGKKDDGQ